MRVGENETTGNPEKSVVHRGTGSQLSTEKPVSDNRSHRTYSRLILHPSFNDTVAELSKMKIQLPSNPSELEMDFNLYNFPPNGKFVSKVEEIQKTGLNPQKGQEMFGETLICAYDESINKFQGLEGTAFLTSHSLVLHGDYDYVPTNLLTFYFYTRSRSLTQTSEYIKYSDNPERDSKRDYVIDRGEFVSNNVPGGSVILIDGPIIGGQMSSYTTRLNEILLKNDVIPLFFVKNSSSNLVTDNIRDLKRAYNSDMHWAYKYLRERERTSLFKYVDRHNERNAKVFCYLKPFDVSPHRVEMHVKTFERYSTIVPTLLDLVCYLLLVQGVPRNPQVRPIAIAEKYARATLGLINLVQTMKYLGITPTMNQERFAW